MGFVEATVYEQSIFFLSFFMIMSLSSMTCFIDQFHRSRNISIILILITAERAILAEYENSICYDEEALTATLNSLTAKTLICPVCQR